MQSVVVEGRKFRDVTGRFATGVTVVTSRFGDEVHGMTVNSFCSVSLDPPLVLFCASPHSRTAALIRDSGVFAINILSADQHDVSMRFAQMETDMGNRFDALGTFAAATGSPLLSDCVAYVDCTVESVTPSGDHLIFIGRVQALDVHRDVAPLVFYASRYRQLQP